MSANQGFFSRNGGAERQPMKSAEGGIEDDPLDHESTLLPSERGKTLPAPVETETVAAETEPNELADINEGLSRVVDESYEAPTSEDQLMAWQMDAVAQTEAQHPNKQQLSAADMVVAIPSGNLVESIFGHTAIAAINADLGESQENE